MKNSLAKEFPDGMRPKEIKSSLLKNIAGQKECFTDLFSDSTRWDLRALIRFHNFNFGLPLASLFPQRRESSLTVLSRLQQSNKNITLFPRGDGIFRERLVEQGRSRVAIVNFNPGFRSLTLLVIVIFSQRSQPEFGEEFLALLSHFAKPLLRDYGSWLPRMYPAIKVLQILAAIEYAFTWCFTYL